MSLRDYRSDSVELSDDVKEDIRSSMYHQEINTLKIDKLSNRVTIISVILPVLIGVVFFFSYLDIQERVTDVDVTKKNQYERLSRQFEEKLNALDVRIAKNRFDVDQKLPVLEKKEQALENQVAKMAASKADVTRIDEAVAKLDASLSTLDKRIRGNASQDKATLAEMERINQGLQKAAQKRSDQVQQTTDGLKKEMAALRQSMDARADAMEGIGTEMARLKKQINAMDKQIKSLEQNRVTQKDLDRRFADLETSLKAKLAIEMKELKIKAAAHKAASKATTAPAKASAIPAPSGITPPQPQLNLEGMETISEETITQ